VLGGDREHRSIQLDAVGVLYHDGPSRDAHLSDARFANMVVIGVDELVNAEAGDGLASHFEVIRFGGSMDKAVGAAIAARVVHERRIADEVSDRSNPHLIDTAGVWRIEERYIEWGTEFDVHATAASAIWKNLVVNRRYEQSTRNGHFPVRDGIDAQELFPARIGDLEIVIAIVQSRGSGRCIWPRTAVEIDA